MTRIAILSDDEFFVSGVLQLIRSESSLTLVTAEHRHVEAIIVHAPDVVLVDSRVEGALDRRPHHWGDHARLIFLSLASEDQAIAALAAGARGIMRKGDEMADLLRAIAMVVKGGVWVPRHVLLEAWLRHRSHVHFESKAMLVEQQLSTREREIVRYVATGMSNKELANHLGISTATVKAHLTSIFQKLGVQGRGELVAAYHGTIANTSTH